MLQRGYKIRMDSNMERLYHCARCSYNALRYFAFPRRVYTFCTVCRTIQYTNIYMYCIEHDWVVDTVTHKTTFTLSKLRLKLSLVVRLPKDRSVSNGMSAVVARSFFSYNKSNVKRLHTKLQKDPNKLESPQRSLCNVQHIKKMEHD